MITVELNFDDAAQVEHCLSEMKTLGVPFTVEHNGGPHPRNVMTKPEYLNVQRSVVLAFESQHDYERFAALARPVYNKHTGLRGKRRPR